MRVASTIVRALPLACIAVACSTADETAADGAGPAGPLLAVSRAGVSVGADGATLLLLGSHEPATRQARVQLACDLLARPDVPFSRIVLSGGCEREGTCNAGASEASDMRARLLTTCAAQGQPIIDQGSLFLEEQSRSTVENYCSSRELVLQQSDSVYVVSDHRHAVSVAACFAGDGLDSHYYYRCQGTLFDGVAPQPQDVPPAQPRPGCFEDYTSIAARCASGTLCATP